MKFTIKILIVVFYLANLTFSQVFIGSEQITIISPSENSLLSVNHREGISWISTDTTRIEIEYSTNDNDWIKIFSNIRSDIEYIGWKIPSSLSGEIIKIRILDSQEKKVLDKTDYWINVKIKDDSNRLLKTNEQEAPLLILPLGNSITFDNRSGDLRVVEDKIGYRFPLYQLLVGKGISFDFIGSEHSGSNFLPSGYDENAGFPGIKSDELTDLLKTGILDMPFYTVYDTITIGPYLETYLPDIILLHIGTNGNDVGGGISSNNVEELLDEVDRIELLFGKTIMVFITRIINRVPNISQVTTLNNNVENMILDRVNNPSNDAYPDNISIVDMENGSGFNYTISPDPNGTPGDMNDFLHPNDKGYGKMAGKWFTNINSFIKDCSNNMISYWQFDNILASVHSDKLGINDATCTSCPTLENGMNDNSLTFNGSNSLNITNDNSINFNLTGSFSIEAWVQTSQSVGENKVFIGKYNGNVAWWLGFSAVDGLARLSVRSSSGTDRALVKSSTIINDGNWHHIVGVKDYYNSVLKIYVDGVLENQVTTNFTGSFTGTNDLSIGAYIASYNLDGLLDEIALYDKSLSNLEVEDNYNKGLIGQDYCNDSKSNIAIKVFLEGPFTSSSMTSILNTQNSLPLLQPFRASPWSYNGAESVSSIPNINAANKIVDWVLVSLRSEASQSSEVAKRAGFLTENGSVYDLDGVSPIAFTVNQDDYYLVIKHRNHLSVMSNVKIPVAP